VEGFKLEGGKRGTKTKKKVGVGKDIKRKAYLGESRM
jgi:hypothetical protein